MFRQLAEITTIRKEIFDEYDVDFYTWKIPGVSSISDVVNCVVQSPSFSFGETSWTLKMYPNDFPEDYASYTSLTIERLETQRNVKCKFYYKNIFNKEIELLKAFPFPYEKKPIPDFMFNLKVIAEDSAIVIDDTLYLVIRLSSKQDNSCESNLPTISVAGIAGTTDGNGSIVGEIFKEYERGKSFYYKVSDIPRELPWDYNIESPEFLFANSAWILKLRPYHRMQYSEKRSFDILLERIEFEVPVQHIILETALTHPHRRIKVESMSFDSDRDVSPALEFHLDELDEAKLKFLIMIRALKFPRIWLEPQRNSVEKTTVDDEKPGPSMMCLKCKALQDYKKMFYAKEDCDVTFRVRERELYAHKLILKHRSPVLASSLQYDMKEKLSGVIEIEDSDPSHFSDFLYFIYCGELDILTTENVFSLFTLADKYDVPDLKTSCRDFIKRHLTIDTFCETITLALLHSEIDLIKLSTEFFAKHMKEIIVTIKWQSFLVENPIQGNDMLIKALIPNNDEVQ